MALLDISVVFYFLLFYIFSNGYAWIIALFQCEMDLFGQIFDRKMSRQFFWNQVQILDMYCIDGQLWNQFIIQVNLCQKLFFLENMGENMLCTEVVLNVKNNFCTGKSLSEALLFPEHGGEHVVYRNWSECRKQFLYTTCSPHVLSLEFSCIELVIQWTICRHIVG